MLFHVRVIEPLLLPRSQISLRPSLLARIDATMFEHEGAHLLAVNTKGVDSCGAAPNEITHRFVPFIRNPHCREFPSPKKLGQRDGVAAVCLDPIAKLAGNQ
jgi:hypothetical protein